jgi:ATP-dependent Clp protease adaptor protein ClpS
MASPRILPNHEADSGLKRYGGWTVTVYNNDDNTYHEVMFILMCATGCAEEEAEIETWEIDHLGKSVVHFGEVDECQKVASVIATIGIYVEVREE